MNDSSTYLLELAPGVRVQSNAIRYGVARSSGPGGQNVNKVNTRVELWLSIAALIDMPSTAVARLRRLAGRRITISGDIHLICQTERSQEGNRRAAMDRLQTLIAQAMIEPTPRKKIKISKSAHRRRLDSKRHRSEIKSGRTHRPE